MDIYSILHSEHLQVLQAIERLRTAQGSNRRAILDRIADELTAHTQAEEAILYDRLAQVRNAKETVLEAKEEHFVATRLLEDLMTMRAGDERFAAKAKVLYELVKHHVDEEERELWREAKAAFDPVVAENFGGEYLAKKFEIQKRPVVVRLGQAHVKKAVSDVGHVFQPHGTR